MKKKLIALLSLSLVFAGCSNDKGNNTDTISNDSIIKQEDVESVEVAGKNEILNKYQTTIYDYFDTITTFTAYTKNEGEFKKYEHLVEEKMKYYHELFSSYDEFDGVNNFYTINKMAGDKPVKVEPVIIDLIKEGKEFYDVTDGDINIAAGSLLKIWTDFRDKANENPDQAKLPERSELEEAAKHRDIDAIEINEEDSTVFIKDKDVQIDNGAIGKGYATEKIKQELIKAGLKNGILSVGGDVAIIGDNPERDNHLYAIAIQNPDLKKNNEYPSVVYVKDNSVVTSGDYQRYFEIKGRKYHHIIDQNTLEPSTTYRSVSVILDDIGKADALSTALFLKSVDEGKELAKKYNAEVFWIDMHNKEYKTDGYKDYEKE